MAYLAECGVTPEYVDDCLRQHGILPSPIAAAAWVEDDARIAPLDHLATEIPRVADQEDGHLWYLRLKTFQDLCLEYDPEATARALADRRLLKYDNRRLTLRYSPPGLFSVRLEVFAVSKRLLKLAEDRGHA